MSKIIPKETWIEEVLRFESQKLNYDFDAIKENLFNETKLKDKTFLITNSSTNLLIIST